MNDERRLFLRAGALTGAVAIVGACGAAAANSRAGREEHEGGGDEAQEVSPTEDLMQEHGLLERILGLYAESARRIRTGEATSGAMLHELGAIAREFVHDYHEHNEEQELFVRAQTVTTLAPLVATLRAQHARGREYNALLTQWTEPAAFADAARRTLVATACEGLVRMYRPHAARENTVLFPAVRGLYSHHDWHELGERLEAEEHRRFANGGFEGMVARVADMERSVGIEDLAQFTAPAM